MLNFREELEKSKKGQVITPSTEEYVEIFLKELLNALNERGKNSGKLIFYLSADEIKIKTGENNITCIFVFHNINALEIFKLVKEKLEFEGYIFDVNSDQAFSINLD